MSVDILGTSWDQCRSAVHIALRPRKPEGSLGQTAQDGHLDSHTAPELWRQVDISTALGHSERWNSSPVGHFSVGDSLGYYTGCCGLNWCCVISKPVVTLGVFTSTPRIGSFYFSKVVYGHHLLTLPSQLAIYLFIYLPVYLSIHLSVCLYKLCLSMSI